MSISDMRCRPVVPADWSAIEQLFGASGACGGCWCMLWRVPSLGQYWGNVKGEQNRQSFRALIERGEAKGCLAWADGQPIGWCGLGPRDDYPYLKRSRTIPEPPFGNAWCVTCFFIARPFRGRGVARQLLGTALDYARSTGAAALEAYPSVPRSASTRIAPAFAHTGVPRLFEPLGFENIGDIGARQVWRFTFDEPGYRKR